MRMLIIAEDFVSLPYIKSFIVVNAINVILQQSRKTMRFTVKLGHTLRTQQVNFSIPIAGNAQDGIAKQAIKVYKMSNAKNPIKTGNIAIDYGVNKIPLVKRWNQGFNLGKMAFVAQQTYNDTCKRKK